MKPEKGKRNGKHGDTRELSDDIIEEILAYLPAKSLRRFCCVSRSWAAMLASDAFVELHLYRANPRRHPKLFRPPFAWHNCRIPIYSWEPVGPVKRFLERGSVADGMLRSTTTPCRGLVLVRGWDWYRDGSTVDPFYILNPSTGDLLALPDGSPPARSEHYNLGWFETLFGLGYDPLAKVYKVARLYCRRSSIHGSLTTCCEVFTLGTSVHWRPAAENPPVTWAFKEEEGVFLNGRLHWLVGGSPNTDYILTFNLSDETFGAVQLPPGVQCYRNGALSKIDEYLCIHCHLFWSEEAIWMLQDYETSCWEKCCIINRLSWPRAERRSSIIPLGMYYGSGREGKFMFVSSKGTVFAVHPNGSALKILLLPTWRDSDVCLRDRTFVDLRLQLFEESLVSLEHPMRLLAGCITVGDN